MADFVRHTSCESCGSSDAKANYSDGSSYCFSCSTYAGPNAGSWQPPQEYSDNKRLIHIPEDISFEYSEEALKWVAKYDLTAADLIRHKVYFSKWRNQLLFFYERFMGGDVGCLLARNFNSNTTKYHLIGSREEVMPVYKSAFDCDTLVLTEDSISAIKVSRVCDAMPCLGSTIGLQKIARIKKMGYEKIRIWLDSDKALSSSGLAQKLAFICDDVRTINTDLDPKCYPHFTIKELVYGHAHIST
jgi:hypothetical protein